MSNFNDSRRPAQLINFPDRRRPPRLCRGCGIRIYSGPPVCLQCRQWDRRLRHLSAMAALSIKQ